MAFLAIITISVEGGSLDLWRRKNSRSLLLIWFRRIALPAFLLTTIPRRGLPFWLGWMNTRKYRVTCRFAFRVAARYSLRHKSRSSLEKDWSGSRHSSLSEGRRIKSYEPFRRTFPENYTLSLFRPLALRRLMTFLPPRVFIRARKPCVLFLRIVLGW